MACHLNFFSITRVKIATSKCINNRKRKRYYVSVLIFQKYLEQFGYLDDKQQGTQHSEESRKHAIRYNRLLHRWLLTQLCLITKLPLLLHDIESVLTQIDGCFLSLITLCGSIKVFFFSGIQSPLSPLSVFHHSIVITFVEAEDSTRSCTRIMGKVSIEYN